MPSCVYRAGCRSPGTCTKAGHCLTSNWCPVTRDLPSNNVEVVTYTPKDDDGNELPIEKRFDTDWVEGIGGQRTFANNIGPVTHWCYKDDFFKFLPLP